MDDASFLSDLILGIVQTSWLEWIAVISGLLYVIFAAMKHQLCWLFAIISSGLYIYICIDFQLYIESGLQLFYVAMAIAGWIAWNKKSMPEPDSLALLDESQTKNDIITWSFTSHVVNIGISSVVTVLVGLFFDYFTNQANPYTDAFTTVFSLAATFMVVQKVLENWIYWIVIDFVGIYLFQQRGLTLTAVLFGLYTLLAIIGFMAWYKRYKRQTA